MQQDGVIPPDQLRRLAATAISEGKLPADSLVRTTFAAHHETTCSLCRLAFAGEPVQLLVGQYRGVALRVALLHVRCFRAWLDVIWPKDGARICGDCGEAIDDDSVIVAVGEDRFHASCYVPPAVLDRIEEMQRLDEFTREDDRDANA